MRIRTFRALGTRDLVLEIGRLRLWVHNGFLPLLPYARHEYGVWMFGAGYWRGMLFDKPSRRGGRPKKGRAG